MFKLKFKKTIVITSATLIVSALLIPAVNSQTSGTGTAATSGTGTAGGSTAAGGGALSGAYLALIAQYTNATANIAYYIETNTMGLLVLLNSLLLPDTTTTSANLQSSFATLTNTAITNSGTQLTLQQKLLPDFYNSVNTNNYPEANDITFGTLLGQPFFTPDPRNSNGSPPVDSSLNYIKNVSGMRLRHVVPQQNWQGTADNQKKYREFYGTVSAIQTYDAYVLSQLYSDNANGGTLTSQQTQLMQQASGSTWFTQVASENLGVVFRQMLMYNSQLYVLMTQMLQTEKQLLATLAMTNTLIVIGDQFPEGQLLQKATTAGA